MSTEPGGESGTLQNGVALADDKPDQQPDTPSPTAGSPRATMCPEWLRIDRKLIFYKLFFFAFLGGLGSVLPYVSVFLKQRGLSPQEIGLISGLRPVIGFLAAPLLGNLGDKFGIRRWLFLLSVAAWLGFYAGLFFIPEAARIEKCPDELNPHRHPGGGVVIPKSQTAQDLSRTSNNISFPLRIDVNGSNGEEEDILQENLSWLYKAGSLHTVFLLALFVILGGEIAQAPTTAFADAGTLQTLGKDALERYGTQRAWGGIGFGTA